jgi:hypothetical protein
MEAARANLILGFIAGFATSCLFWCLTLGAVAFFVMWACAGAYGA